MQETVLQPVPASVHLGITSASVAVKYVQLTFPQIQSPARKPEVKI